MPEGTDLGRVRLQVSDLVRALAFYSDLLGFRLVRQEGSIVTLSASGGLPHHVVLVERAGARPKPQQTTGLYHVAIRFPNRQALGRSFRRLVAHRWPFQGFADHQVSEALYLADPDGNGLELYADRPREQWRQSDGQIAMATDPLDVEALLAEAATEEEPWTGIDPGTDIGHVHLQVSDLGRAEAFYSGLLGLDVTQRGYPGALFLSAGGYHHHLGLNTWAGAGAAAPPLDAVGLLSFSLEIPDAVALQAVLGRLQAFGVKIEDSRDGRYAQRVLLRDPDGHGVELLAHASTKFQED